jgi:alanine dehydrogenase
VPADLRPPFVPAEAVHAALAYPALIEALREAFAAGGEVPVRHHHAVPRPGAEPATLLLMPAWQAGRTLGIKVVTVCPGNEARGEPSVQGLYLLLDGITGRPLAVLDATALTVRRTACASALAASYLAREDSRHLVLIGAGALAPHLARAHAAVRPIERVTIWNRTRPRAEALASELGAGGLRAAVADEPAAAVAAADIVTCCTMSSEPVLQGAWLPEGCHVDLVGAFRPDMRESDDEAIRRARVFVDTRSGAFAEAGDIVQAIASGALAEAEVEADLFDLCGGRHPGRRGPGEITLFKSVGSALEDLAAARLVVEAGRS